MWSMTVSPRGGSLHRSMAGMMTRWPLEETGRNSVSPWMRPRMISCTSYGSQGPPGAPGSIRQGADGFPALARAFGGDGGHHVEQQAPDPVEVGLEEAEHLGLGDRLDPRTFHPRVVVGDEGDGGVADAQLPGQVGLGVLGHVDDLEALAAVPAGLRPGREAGALGHDDG